MANNATNRGVVYKGPGKVAVESIDFPRMVNPRGKSILHGVIIKLVATNICGSDQHMVRGRTTAPTGLVLGHEITGEIIEAGPDVEFLKVGDLVSIPFNVACGRCRTCREPISARYPIVEALTAVLFVGVALRFGMGTATSWAIGPFWVLAACAVALSAIDLDTHRLPDPIVGFAYLAGGAGLLAASAAGAGDGLDALGRAGIGAAAGFTLHLVALIAYPQGMGFGDVKLAGVTGMFWNSTYWCL